MTMPDTGFSPEWESIWNSWVRIHKAMLVCDHPKYDSNLRKMKSELYDVEPRLSLGELEEASRWIWRNKPETPWECHLKAILDFLDTARAVKARAAKLRTDRLEYDREAKQREIDRKNKTGVFAPGYDEAMASFRKAREDALRKALKPVGEVLYPKKGKVSNGETKTETGPSAGDGPAVNQGSGPSG